MRVLADLAQIGWDLKPDLASYVRLFTMLMTHRGERTLCAMLRPISRWSATQFELVVAWAHIASY